MDQAGEFSFYACSSKTTEASIMKAGGCFEQSQLSNDFY